MSALPHNCPRKISYLLKSISSIHVPGKSTERIYPEIAQDLPGDTARNHSQDAKKSTLQRTPLGMVKSGFSSINLTP